jgi:hypothetical protein
MLPGADPGKLIAAGRHMPVMGAPAAGMPPSCQGIATEFRPESQYA